LRSPSAARRCSAPLPCGPGCSRGLRRVDNPALVGKSIPWAIKRKPDQDRGPV
jgi:hypothetical protein